MRTELADGRRRGPGGGPFPHLSDVVPTELPGQLCLFDDPDEDDDEIELCDECGSACTSSKECVEISGLYDEQE